MIDISRRIPDNSDCRGGDRRALAGLVLLLSLLATSAPTARAADPSTQPDARTGSAMAGDFSSLPASAQILTKAADSLGKDAGFAVARIEGPAITRGDLASESEARSTTAADADGRFQVSQAAPLASGATGQAKPAPLAIQRDPEGAMTQMAEALDKQAATAVLEVNGKNITLGDIADTIRQMPISMASLGFQGLYRYAIDQLLREKLLLSAAEKAGLENDPVVQRRRASRADLALSQEWLNRTAAAKVTEEAMHARYDRDIAGKPGPEEVRARVILVATDAEARAIIARVKGGEDFATLAQQLSIDASAVAGGDTGFIQVQGLGAEVGSVIFSMLPGEITAYPVHAAPGYFIVRVEARRQTATPTFEAARIALRDTLRKEAAARIIRSLEGAATVRKLSPPPLPGTAQNDH